MVDELTERYGDLLTGFDDCVDRIVINAYFPWGHNRGGFGVWWRRLPEDSDELLDRPTEEHDVEPSRGGSLTLE